MKTPENDTQTILLVEDEKILAMATSRKLKGFGFGVEVAHNGQKAVEIATKDTRIDLILMDINLDGEMDGTEAARQILAKRHVPIVFLTSHTEEEYVNRVKKITRYGYVIKNSGDFVLKSSIEMAFELFKQHQKTLASEQKYHTLFETANDAIFLADGETGEILEANKQAEQLTGLPREELIGMHQTQLHPEPMRESASQSFLDDISRKERTIYKSFDVQHRDGHTIPVEISPTIIQLDGRTCIYGIFRDISERKQMEEELKEHLQEMEVIASSIPHVIWKSDVDEAGNFTGGYISDTADELLSLPPNTIRNNWQTFFKYIKPDYLPMIMEKIKAGVENPGQTMSLEYEVIKGNQEVAWFSSTGRAFVENDTVRIFGFTVDITEKRQAEQALQESEWQLKSIIQNSPIGIGVGDGKGNLVECNEALAKMVGYSHEEMLELTFEHFTHPEDYAKEIELVRKLRAGEINSYRMEKRYIHRDGHMLWVDICGILTQNAAGTRQFGCIFVQEITERKKAEAAVKEREEQYRMLAANLPEMDVYLFDNDMRFLIAEGSLMRKWGVSPDYFEGKRLPDLLDEERLKIFQPAYERALYGDHVKKEFFYRGSYFHHEVIPLKDHHGNVYGGLALTQDITEQKNVQVSLRESEAKYRLLLENAEIGIGYYDLQGRVLLFNNLAATYLGGVPEDFVGKTLHQLFGEDADRYMERLKVTTTSRESHDYEDLLSFDDHDIWFLSKYTPIIDWRNKVIGVQILSSDITERKQAEQALRQSEERFQAFMHFLPGVTFIKDENNRILFCNKQFADMLGQSPEDIIGANEDEYLTPELNEKYFQENQTVFREEKLLIIESSFPHKGQVTDWQTYKFPIKLDGQTLLGAISFDISERKRAQENLRASERKLRQIMKSVPGIIYQAMIDSAGQRRYIFLSEKVEDYTGLTASEILADADQLINALPPEDRDDFEKALAESYQNLTPFRLTHRITTKTGDVIWLHNQSIPEKMADGSVIWTGVAIDITPQKEAEQALKESENRLQYVMQTVPGIIFQSEIDPEGNGRFALISGKVHEYTGFTIEEVMADPQAFVDAVHPDDRRRYDDAVMASYERLTPFKLTHRMITRAGQTIWLYNQSLPDQKPDGTVTWTGVAIDITTHKKTEQALKESERRYSALLSSIEAGVVIHDNHGAILDCSAKAEEMLGRSREKLLGIDAEDEEWHLLREDGSPMPPEEFPVMQILSHKQPVHNAILGIVRPDQEKPTWLMVSGVPEFDENGNIIRVINTFMNITERKKIEEALHENRLLLNETGKIARVGGWKIDIATKHLTWTPEIYHINELPLDFEPTVEAAINFCDEESRDTIRNAVSHAIETGDSFDLELGLITAKDNRLAVRVIGNAKKDDTGKTEALYGVLQDITDQKSTRLKLENAFQEKQALLDELQHRVKNSFALITSMINLMQDQAGQASVKKALAEIGSRARALSEMYDLLYTTKSVTHVRLDEYLQRIAASLPFIGSHVTLHEQYDPVVCTVKTAIPLGMITVELITNALKYAFPDGTSGKINLKLQKTKKNIKLEIRDNGIGLPPEFDQENITSIGLTITHALADQINAKLTLKSQQGTHWTLEILAVEND